MTTVMLGVTRTSIAAFETRPILYWDPEKGDRGYHTISRNAQGEPEQHYLSGTAHEEQAGISLSRVRARFGQALYWVKQPVPIISDAKGFVMDRALAAQFSDPFTNMSVSPELSDPNLLIGFAPREVLESRRVQWYETLEAAVDKLLPQSTPGKVATLTDWLYDLACTENQYEQASLRSILTHPKENIADYCKMMAALYRANDVPIDPANPVPQEKIFANPENVQRALKELKERLGIKS